MRVGRSLLAVAILAAGSLVIGMVGYVGLAGMTAVDAFVNAAMLLGGMGPVNALPTDGAKLFAGAYALYCGIVFLISAGILAAPIFHRLLHHFHLEDDDEAGGSA
jgi:hypothetical protein